LFSVEFSVCVYFIYLIFLASSSYLPSVCNLE